MLLSGDGHTPAQPVDQNGRPYNRIALVFTMLVGTFSTFLTSTMLTTAFPTLMKSFSISANTVQWLTTGFMLMMGITIPITGFFLQRFDSGKLYLAAIIIFFSWNYSVLLCPRFLDDLNGPVDSRGWCWHYRTGLPNHHDVHFSTVATGGCYGNGRNGHWTSTRHWADTFGLDLDALFLADAVFVHPADLTIGRNHGALYATQGITH